jgi:hypothetical protein
LRTKLGLHPENGYRLAAIYSVGYRLEAIAPPASGHAGADATETAHHEVAQATEAPTGG